MKLLVTLQGLALAVILCFVLWQNELEKRSKALSYESNVESEKKLDVVQIALNSYVKGLNDGLTHWQIADRVFNASKDLPNAVRKFYRHSYPFVTGDTFRAFADIIFDFRSLERIPNRRSRPLAEGDVVFVDGRTLDAFVVSRLHFLDKPFILVTHNSDKNSPHSPHTFRLLKHPLLIKWFARNAAIYHPKLIPIPIGFINWDHKPLALPHILAPRALNVPDINHENRTKLVYMNFKINADRPEFRKVIVKHFTERKLAEFEELGTQEGFWRGLETSKYVLSPPGHGTDCFRHWEAVLFKAVPIVRNSTLWPLFRFSPVLVMPKDWAEVIDEEYLRNTFKVSPQRLSRRMVLAQFWFDIINSYRPKHHPRYAPFNKYSYL